MPDQNPGGDAPSAEPTETQAPDVSTEGGDVQPENSDNKSEDTQDNKQDDEPQVIKRKTAKDFIIERQQRKIAKLEGQESQDYDDDSIRPEPVESEPDDGDDSDQQMEAMRPIIEQHIADKDAEEVTAFLNENPEFGDYAEKVEKMMKHPSRRSIPVNELFFAAAGPDLLKLGAKMAQEADDEADTSRIGGGGSSYQGVTPKDWSNASQEELDQEKMRIRQAAR